MSVVTIDTRKIVDWDSFHTIFAEAFGFPGYYGRNMNAWIDCLTYLNDPDGCDTRIKAEPGRVVVLQLQHMRDFSKRCPELYAAIVDCAAFVNCRLIATGQPPTLALAWRE